MAQQSKRKRKPGSGASKGGEYERNICKRLGLWWSNGDRDDIFWRTSNSGGRATQRAERSTFGQAGDIQATHPSGQPLMNVVCLELKTGYPKVSLLDCLEDKQPKEGIFNWINQSTAAALKNKAPHWGLIWKRNRRMSLIFLPSEMMRDLSSWTDRVLECNRLVFHDKFRGGNVPSMEVMPLDEFFNWCTPSMIISFWRGS